LPWGENIDLVADFKDLVDRLCYAEVTLEQGWSRLVLAAQLQTWLRIARGRQSRTLARAAACRCQWSLAECGAASMALCGRIAW
jgi:predicted nuclease of restriction endonuclease-like (RecB) superfamily